MTVEIVYYMAGPMSGIPQFNFPAFHAAADSLRSKGHNIISPAELDSKAIQTIAMKSEDGTLTDGKIAGETWGDLLSRDVKIIADSVQGVVLLPGWEKSKGAKLEAFVGLLCKHKFALYNNGGLHPIDSDFIKDELYAAA